MATKATFIYRVEIGHHPNVEQVEFCYARNSEHAVDHFREQFKDRRFDLYKAYKVGEADYRKHPDPFETMPLDEEWVMRRTKATVGEEYAERRDNVSGIHKDTGIDRERGNSVQREKEEPIPSERERVSDSDE